MVTAFYLYFLFINSSDTWLETRKSHWCRQLERLIYQRRRRSWNSWFACPPSTRLTCSVDGWGRFIGHWRCSSTSIHFYFQRKELIGLPFLIIRGVWLAGSSRCIGCRHSLCRSKKWRYLYIRAPVLKKMVRVDGGGWVENTHKYWFLWLAQDFKITMDGKILFTTGWFFTLAHSHYAGLGVRNGLKFVNTSCWKCPLAALK